MNVVILHGNLGADPELKYTQSGLAVANLRLATTDRIKRGDEWVDDVQWHRVTVFGARGEGMAKHLSKGSQVVVRGRITYYSYEDKDGVKRYSTQIIADDIRFAGSKKSGTSSDRGSDSGSSGGSSGGSKPKKDEPAYDSFDPDNDIPF